MGLESKSWGKCELTRIVHIHFGWALLFPLHYSILLRSRTVSTFVGDGHGHCCVPSPLIATMEHLATQHFNGVAPSPTRCNMKSGVLLLCFCVNSW